MKGKWGTAFRHHTRGVYGEWMGIVERMHPALSLNQLQGCQVPVRSKVIPEKASADHNASSWTLPCQPSSSKICAHRHSKVHACPALARGFLQPSAVAIRPEPLRQDPCSNGPQKSAQGGRILEVVCRQRLGLEISFSSNK